MEKIPVCARRMTRTQTTFVLPSLKYLTFPIISNSFSTLWPGPRETERSIQIFAEEDTDNMLNHLARKGRKKKKKKLSQISCHPTRASDKI